jgi:hypothetical protein
MNLLAVGLAAVVVAGQDPKVENSMFEELLQKGVLMSDGSRIKLPAPTLREGMTPVAQREAVTRLTRGKRSYEDLTQDSLQAPYVLDIRTVPTTNERSPARAIDLWFVAHGDFKKATSEEFLEKLWKSVKPQGNDPVAAKTATLPQAELARRNIQLSAQAGLEERFVFGRGTIFDRVQLSATQHGVVTRQADRVVLAEKIDPRFTGDQEYPNQWQSLKTDEEGKLHVGPPQPYAFSGAYLVATALADPPGAVFFEFHLVFEEPYGWFEGAGLVSSKVPLAVSDNLRTFRRRLSLPDKPR